MENKQPQKQAAGKERKEKMTGLMKYRKYRYIPAVILALFSLVGMNVWGAQSLDLNRRGSISVTLQDPETLDAITGEGIILYRAADVNLENDADYSFLLTGDFEDAKETLETLDGELAKRLAAYALEKKISGTLKSTNASGQILFGDLTPGLYLITQDPAKKSDYEMSPFLVTLPLRENGEYIYEVDAAPKMEALTKIPEEPKDPEGSARTGDEARLFAAAAAFGGSLLVLILILAVNRRRAGKSKE